MSYAESFHGYLTEHNEISIRDAVIELEEAHGIAPSEYVVVGGANLVLRGIRRYTVDLDVLVSHDAHQTLMKSGAAVKELPYFASMRGDNNVSLGMYLGRNRVPLSATTHLPGNGTYPLDFQKVRETAEMVQSVPCLHLDEMVASKTALRRKKDIVDLRLLAAHLDKPLEIPQPLHYDPLY